MMMSYGMTAEGKAGYDNPDKNDMLVLHARECKPKKNKAASSCLE
jgi:hypothetical protein